MYEARLTPTRLRQYGTRETLLLRLPNVPVSGQRLAHAESAADLPVTLRRSERTQNYSPFLYNVVMAVGCRYLDARPVSEGGDDYPMEICGLIGDPETR